MLHSKVIGARVMSHGSRMRSQRASQLSGSLVGSPSLPSLLSIAIDIDPRDNGSSLK